MIVRVSLDGGRLIALARTKPCRVAKWTTWWEAAVYRDAANGWFAYVRTWRQSDLLKEEHDAAVLEAGTLTELRRHVRALNRERGHGPRDFDDLDSVIFKKASGATTK